MSAAPPAATAVPTTTNGATTPAVTPPAAPEVKKTEEITDTQTGKKFVKLPERWYDVASAWLSAAYSLAVIGYLTFMVLYMRSGKFAFWPKALTALLTDLLTVHISTLLLYSAIGGAMGAAVNNLRSFITWHAEDRAFGWRFIWKYIAMPPLGGTLAVLVYGILQGGMAAINGGTTPVSNELTSLSAWATGTLAGYGSHKVFIWLDDKVNLAFKIDKKSVAVPNVTGQPETDAKKTLESAQLSVGTVTTKTVSSAAEAGKVITQSPSAGTQIDCGSKVDLVVGITTTADGTDPTIAPELAGKTTNGNGVPTNGSGVLADATKTPTGTTDTSETTDTGGTTDTSGTDDADTTETTETATADDTATDDTTATETPDEPAGDEAETANVGTTNGTEVSG